MLMGASVFLVICLRVCMSSMDSKVATEPMRAKLSVCCLGPQWRRARLRRRVCRLDQSQRARAADKEMAIYTNLTTTFHIAPH